VRVCEKKRRESARGERDDRVYSNHPPFVSRHRDHTELVAMKMLRTLLVLGLASSVTAWGKKKDKEGAKGVMDDLDEAAHMQQAEVDAMARQAGARDYELENIARHKAGELNTAQLGLENMKHALNDPSAMAEMAQMMRDPESMKAVREMMQDPQFQAQAQAMKDQMMSATGGQMPDIAKMMQDPAVMQKAQAMAQAMYGGGASAGDPAAAELARLRAENAALKAQAGI
jgi:hypothetical protein